MFEVVAVFAQALAVIRREHHQRLATRGGQKAADPMIDVADLGIIEGGERREIAFRESVEIEERRGLNRSVTESIPVEVEATPVHDLVVRSGRVVHEVRIHVVHPE